MQRHSLFPSRLSWTARCGRIPWLCSLSITYSAGAPVEHLSLLACVNQKPRSGEGNVESWNSYLCHTAPKRQSKRDLQKDGGGAVYVVDSVCGDCTSILQNEGKGDHPQWPRPTPVPPFILFIKGTFHHISLLSFCPSAATIHFNSAPVEAVVALEARAVGVGRAGLLI